MLLWTGEIRNVLNAWEEDRVARLKEKGIEVKETFLAVARDPKPDPPKSEEKKKKTGKDAKAAAGKGKKGKTAAKKGKTGVAKGKKNNSAANSNAKKAGGKGKSKYVVQAKTTKRKAKK